MIYLLFTDADFVYEQKYLLTYTIDRLNLNRKNINENDYLRYLIHYTIFAFALN